MSHYNKSFIIFTDYVDHFEISNINNVVQISTNKSNTLPPEVIKDNDFVILTVEARRERAISAKTTVIIDIEKEEEVQPVFNHAYYRGLYTEDYGLQFEENINLSEGYDESVHFYLDGGKS